MTIGGLALSFPFHLFYMRCPTVRKALFPVPVPYFITRMPLQTDHEIASRSALDLITAIVQLSSATPSGVARTSPPGQGVEIALRSPCNLPDLAGIWLVNRLGQTEMRTSDRIVRSGRPDPALAKNGLMGRATEVLIPAKALQTGPDWHLAKARPTSKALPARAQPTVDLGLNNPQAQIAMTDRIVLARSGSPAADTTMTGKIELLRIAPQDTHLRGEKMSLQSSQEQMVVRLEHITKTDRRIIRRGTAERITRLRVLGPTVAQRAHDETCLARPIHARRTTTPLQRGSSKIPTTEDWMPFLMLLRGPVHANPLIEAGQPPTALVDATSKSATKFHPLRTMTAHQLSLAKVKIGETVGDPQTVNEVQS
jgi:hypothetical protein